MYYRGIEKCFDEEAYIMMEGALGERLKREYKLTFDDNIAMAKLVRSKEGRNALTKIWNEYISIAKKYKFPFLATTPTRRANKERIKYACEDKSILLENVNLLKKIQSNSQIEMYIGGLMGCKGDAYTGKNSMSAEEAYKFHSWQTNIFKEADIDFFYAGIMPVLSEAIGMAQAMSDTHIPYIISFTIQKNGRLIDNTTIYEAINEIDNSVNIKPLCYMTNCVYPSIVYEALSQPFNQIDLVRNRFRGIQANTSSLPYNELDNSKDLKCSSPVDFSNDIVKLCKDKGLKIFGGCCGTDNYYMELTALKLNSYVINS